MTSDRPPSPTEHLRAEIYALEARMASLRRELDLHAQLTPELIAGLPGPADTTVAGAAITLPAVTVADPTRGEVLLGLEGTTAWIEYIGQEGYHLQWIHVATPPGRGGQHAAVEAFVERFFPATAGQDDATRRSAVEYWSRGIDLRAGHVARRSQLPPRRVGLRVTGDATRPGTPQEPSSATADSS